jgi:hypothetical protein
MFNGVQIVVFVLAVLTCAAWLVAWSRCRHPLPRARAAVVVSIPLHVAVFSVCAYFHFLTAGSLNIWSCAVRAHGLLTLLILGIEQCADRDINA